jgi:hypothetical protein
MAEKVEKSPWTRKHDDPRHDLISEAPCIVYAQSLADLIKVCKEREPNERLKAAGSHWALSRAALSDHTFIETHDPRNRHQALGKTLKNVIPHCLTTGYIQHMRGHASEDKWYLAHIEAGKRIYQLYAELDQPVDLDDDTTLGGFIKKKFNDARFGGPWAFETLGGAGGQTVVGALNTGTHGGDFDRPPVSDSVLAIHLVADGGKHYWIEQVARGVPQMTEDVRLREQFGIPALGGPQKFEIIRNDDVFDAALVSVGRFGSIYSIVVKALPQYALRETRELALWQDVREHIKKPSGFLYTAEPNQRFLQVAVCLTTHLNFHQNLVGITRRWTRPMSPGTPGKAERIGAIAGDGFDEPPGAALHTRREQPRLQPRRGSPRASGAAVDARARLRGQQLSQGHPQAGEEGARGLHREQRRRRRARHRRGRRRHRRRSAPLAHPSAARHPRHRHRAP